MRQDCNYQLEAMKFGVKKRKEKPLTVQRVLLDFFVYFQMDLLQEFYETTLDALKDAKNDRLWFKTNTKVGLILKLKLFI